MEAFKENIYIWSFGEDIKIRYYNAAEKEDSIVNSYNYTFENKRLTITLNSKERLEYKVEVNSTGNFIILNKKKK